MRPIRSLPRQRVTLAATAVLAWSEVYGQLRTMQEPDRRLASRAFSVVRHRGVCPVSTHRRRDLTRIYAEPGSNTDFRPSIPDM